MNNEAQGVSLTLFTSKIYSNSVFALKKECEDFIVQKQLGCIILCKVSSFNNNGPPSKCFWYWDFDIRRFIEFPEGNYKVAWDRLVNKYALQMAPSLLKLNCEFHNSKLESAEKGLNELLLYLKELRI